jgi:hypothetical protein
MHKPGLRKRNAQAAENEVEHAILAANVIRRKDDSFTAVSSCMSISGERQNMEGGVIASCKGQAAMSKFV